MPIQKIKLIISIIFVILAVFTFQFLYQNKIIENKPSETQNLSGSAFLSWALNTEPDLAGYKIYYGTEMRKGDCPATGGYPQSVDVGNVIEYNFNNLEAGRTYYFSITSYDKSNNESCFSQEVKKIIE